MFFYNMYYVYLSVLLKYFLHFSSVMTESALRTRSRNPLEVPWMLCSRQYLLTSLLARSPDDPQRIRVASVFETFTWLFFVLCSLSANFLHFIHLPANFISFHSFQILKYSLWIHFTPPGVTSERRLARSTRRYIGTALRGALYSLSYLLFVVCM